MVFEWPSCSWATARMPIVKTRGVVPSSLPSRGRVLHLLAHQHMRTARTSSCIHEVCYKGGRWACLQRRRRSSGRSRYKRRPSLLQAAVGLATSGGLPWYKQLSALLHGATGVATWSLWRATMAPRPCCHRQPAWLQKHIGAATKIHLHCYHASSAFVTIVH
jgi:hypothetical protein